MKRTSRLTYLTSLVVIILSALCFVSCEKEDSKAPQITVINDGPVDVTGGAVVKTAGASLRIGDTEIATWADDRTAAEMCKVTMAFDGKAINDGATLDKAGKLTLSVADEAGNSSSSSVTTTVDSKAPQITLASEEVNVFGGLELTSAGGALFIGEHEIARWSDDKTSADQCTVTATLDGETISLGTVLDKAGILRFVITDDAGNASGEKTVILTDNALYGIDALAGVSFTVDHEYDLTEIITTVNGFAISKVAMLLDGNKTTIPDPAHFSSDRWGDASLVITISREDGKSEEIVVDGIRINPLEFSAYSIDKVDNENYWPGYDYRPGVSGWRRTAVTTDLTRAGVYDTQSVILEAITNGTMTMDASSVQQLLKKNTLVLSSECCEPSEPESEYFEALISPFGPNPGTHDDEVFRRIAPSGHGTGMVKEMLIISQPILKKLGKKIIGPLANNSGFCLPVTIVNYLLPYVQSHKDMNFFFSQSTASSFYSKPGRTESFYFYGEDPEVVKSFFKQDNVFFASQSNGNIGDSSRTEDGGEAPNIVITFEEHQNGVEGLVSYPSMYGYNAIMGADYRGITHGCRYIADYYAALLNDDINGGSTIWASNHANDPYVWSTSSQNGDWLSSEPTSPAASSFTGKAYLATCANMLANPNISRQENHDLLRQVAIDGTVLLNGEYYYTCKQMNPGGTLYQFFSKMPETVSMSGNNLIPIEHSLHINSVIVGPGIVDENGTEVTKENYSQMLGKKLFIEPVKLYKYGYKSGDSIEYTEHLCCDSKGSGAHDNASEAYKSIISKTFPVKIQ